MCPSQYICPGRTGYPVQTVAGATDLLQCGKLLEGRNEDQSKSKRVSSSTMSLLILIYSPLSDPFEKSGTFLIVYIFLNNISALLFHT